MFYIQPEKSNYIDKEKLNNEALWDFNKFSKSTLACLNIVIVPDKEYGNEDSPRVWLRDLHVPETI